MRAPPVRGLLSATRSGGADGAAPPTLDAVSNALIAAAMGMQGAESPPTNRQVEAVTAARGQATTAMARWAALSTTGLATLNAKLKAAGQPEVTLPK